jgi:DMSO/TMAO reductase YedYZ heme-binding membrane subunit
MAHDDFWSKLRQEFTKPSPLVISIGVILLILIAVMLYTAFMGKNRRMGGRRTTFVAGV